MSNKPGNFNETIEEAIQTYKAIRSETLDADEKVEHIERHFELEERRKELREKL
ncbi:hypothetical protein [Lysinibacillus fusiformis]|uniref:hypothetical protein n=1 Tax=Lysinibacillus fusiformis TaxID=28031 RepID=UPI0015E0E7AC|nr:hypothetical protein [Lysinibacillus fusiformis]